MILQFGVSIMLILIQKPKYMIPKSESEEPIRVIIADDHVLYRAGVKTALSAKKDIKVIAEADNGMHLLNMLKNVSTDVILLDIQMPVMDGITTLPEIKKLYPNIKNYYAYHDG